MRPKIKPEKVSGWLRGMGNSSGHENRVEQPSLATPLASTVHREVKTITHLAPFDCADRDCIGGSGRVRRIPRRFSFARRAACSAGLGTPAPYRSFEEKSQPLLQVMDVSSIG